MNRKIVAPERQFFLSAIEQFKQAVDDLDTALLILNENDAAAVVVEIPVVSILSLSENLGDSTTRRILSRWMEQENGGVS